jgi:crotonobetainyl-CoA:carnitine CoA-transferase CaiB-like acyl-CoA transferase
MSGRGEDIRAALFETNVFWMTQHLSQVQLAGFSPGPRDQEEASGIGRSMGWGVYQLFDTRDGKQLFIAATTDRHWQALCTLLSLPELGSDPRFASNALRSTQRPLFIPQISAAVKQYAVAELVPKLRDAGIPYAPVNGPADLVDEPHLNEGNHLMQVQLLDGRSYKLPTLPLQIGDDHFDARLSPPALGEHTAAILAELGYSPSEIASMREAGAATTSSRMLNIDPPGSD